MTPHRMATPGAGNAITVQVAAMASEINISSGKKATTLPGRP